LVDLQQKVGEFVLSITSCPIIILENNLYRCNIIGYNNINYWYNVSPIHLRALLGVGSARNGNLEVAVYFLKAKQGYNVRNKETDNSI
jgi:hypothetical protein